MVSNGRLELREGGRAVLEFGGHQIVLVPGIAPETVFNKELRRLNLSGRLTGFVVPDRCNFVECRLDRFETNNVDFSRCDFKDTAITESAFTATKFVGIGFVLNTIFKTRFDRCNFFDTVIQNCEFYDVEFEDCDFNSLVVKDCSFTRCSFKRCITSSKLFEMCLLNSCHFIDTQLQLQTITENFGLRASQISAAIRSDRIDHPHNEMDHPALEQELGSEARPLARLALHFYLNESLLDGSPALDDALTVGFWIGSQSTIGSFSIILTRLCEFLITLLEQNELTYLPLAQLHAVTSALASAVPSDARLRQAAFAVYGAHLIVARQIEEFGAAIQTFAKSRRRKWTFLVAGRHPRKYYKEEMHELFLRGRPEIISLVPHNSPWEMALSFPSAAGVAAFFGLFLATRTRLELRKIVEDFSKNPTDSRRVKGKQVQIAQITIGAARGGEARSLVHITTPISPTFAADFQLCVSTKCIGRIRRLMLAWLK